MQTVRWMEAVKLLTCVPELLGLDGSQLLPCTVHLPAQCGGLAHAGPIESFEQVAMPPAGPPTLTLPCTLHASPHLQHQRLL